MKSYQQRIAECVPAHVDPRHVEAFMRLEHGCLDGLSAPVFQECARSCSQAVLADDAAAERLAQSYVL